MEHSGLHALLLVGLIVALGGPVAVLGLYLPSARFLGPDPGRDELVATAVRSATRWIVWAAGAAVLATFLDFFVEVAELQGKTVFGGLDLPLVLRFATHSTVGRLDLLRMALLLLTAGAALLPGEHKWWLVGGLAAAAVAATSLVSHAAAQPDHRFSAIAAQVGHIAAAAVWMGVLIHLFAVRRRMLVADVTRPRLAFVAQVVRRFSPIALAMTSLLFLTGIFAACRFIGNPCALFTSAYGLTLLVKLALLLPAVFAGFVNYRFIRPRLLASAASAGQPLTSAPVLPWFARTLELEVTAGLLVIILAGILASVSPPGGDGSYLSLTPAQVHALLSPHLPRSTVVNPITPAGALFRTVDDLRYAEFTHNWSGVMVCLLGLGWLLLAAGGRPAAWSARLLPFLLIPFGLFVAIASDLEVWWLREVSFRQAIGDPQILEHQLGALMVFVLAWLSWRDRKNLLETRPLGYALPVIMIAGSLLLLGHAHSTLTVTDELTNMINVQHAVLGALGLFAGAARLLVLRGSLRVPAFRYLWAVFVIGLGVFMAFFYREAV